MSKNPGVLPRWSHRCAASVLLLLTVCTQVPPTSSVMIPPVPAGGARIWIYRTSGPHDSQDRPYLRLNGQVAGISEPNGAFYRDVPPDTIRFPWIAMAFPILINLQGSISPPAGWPS